MDAAVKWAVRNYDHAFSLPKVEVFSGDGDGSFAKVQEVMGKGALPRTVPQHPF
jgi:hypothetical protein